MKLVSELSEKQVEKIIELLTEDGFKNIKANENSISFEEGSRIKREYEIMSTDFTNDEDLGVRMDFDFEKFMAQNYIHKTRHSVSLKDAIEKYGSIEDACNYLEWRLMQVKDLNKDANSWHAGFHMDAIYEVSVGNSPHVIINEEVYEGELARLWAMGNKSAAELLAGYKISAYLHKINKD